MSNIWAKPNLCPPFDGGTTLPPGSSGDHRDLSYRDAADQHPILSITGLQAALDTKSAKGHQHPMTDVLGLPEALNGKANTLHSHSEIDIVDLDKYTQAEVDAFLSNKSDVGHTHVVGDIPDIGDHYAPLVHTHDADEVTYDNTVSGLTAVDVQEAIDELSDITDPGEVIQASIDFQSGDGLPTGDLNSTDFTGHPEADGTALRIEAGDIYVLYHASAAYLWSGPRNVTVGIGGSYIAVPADLVALSTDDHNSLINRDMVDQHPISSITNLQVELDGKSDTGHAHDIADVTGLQTELDGKADTAHTHFEVDITDLDKYSQTAVDLLLDSKLDMTHLTADNNWHVPIGGVQGLVLLKASNADRDVKWAYLEEILEQIPGGDVAAIDVTFVNIPSGLISTDVQNAINELAAKHNAGASGSFTTQDGKTVIVVNGIITDIS